MGNQIEIVVKTDNRAAPGFSRIKEQVDALKNNVVRASEMMNAALKASAESVTRFGERVKVAASEARIGLGEAATSAGKLDRELGNAGARAQGAAGHVRGVGVAASGAGANMSAAGGHASRLGSAFDFVKERAAAAVAFVKTAALGITTALGAAAVGAVGWGIKQAAGNQTAMVSFELLLGTVKKATDFLNKLKDFAAATPFDLPSLKEAASRLLAVGVNVKDVIPLMRNLGNATAGMGTGAEGIQRAVLALQQMKQAGAIHAGDMLQLVEAGIPAWDALAAHMHKTVAQVKEEMSKPGSNINPELLFAAIENAEGPAFTRLKGMMDKQSTTLVGVWSTFKDNMGQKLGDAFAPAIPAATKFLDWASRAVPKAIDGITSVISKIGGFLKSSGIGDELKDMFASLNFGDTFKDIKKDAQNFATEIKKHWPEIKTLIKGVALVLGGVVLALLKIIDFGLKVDTAMVSVWAGLVRVARAWLNAVGNIVTGAAKAFGWVPGLGGQLKQAATDFNKFRDGVNRSLDEIRPKRVPITPYLTTQVLSVRVQQEFGARQHASGGVASGLIEVGEHGRELLKVPTGSMVIPNGQTENMLSAASSSKGNAATGVDLGFVGNLDAALAKVIMKLFRDGYITVKQKHVTA